MERIHRLKFIFISVTTILSLNGFSQTNVLETEIGSKDQSLKSSKIEAKVGVNYNSNFHKASSSQSQNFIVTTAGLSHDWDGKRRFNYAVSYTQDMENNKEGDLDDLTFSVSGISKKVSDSLTGVIVPKLRATLNEDRRKIQYSQGSAALDMSLAYQHEKIDWAVASLLGGVQKNAHEFKQTFNGDSNTNYSYYAGAGLDFTVFEKLTLSTAYLLYERFTYENRRKDSIGAYQVAATYQIDTLSSIYASLSTDTNIYNPEGRSKALEKLLIDSTSVFSTGVNFKF
ncbi:MAG: hypothetical protein H6621_11120 [Halobacteriovoraceae bacterium]|nr:hypothetical protein [Halobacteriovoraceae bacterium]MCB9095609.1 hypothetical protein [Halobacteriovoraceae bacterium]